MSIKQSVAIYARISQDRSGDELGVTRQLQDCRNEAERRGWVVAEEYVDDDVSAYSGKVRPAYERMLRDIEDGLRDAVIVWHLDRLHRRPVELEGFVDTCSRANLKDVVTLHGDVDLAKGDGLLVARIMGAVAANESDSKRRRIARKALETAEAGLPHMGGTRPFGYEDDRVTIRESEAVVIRDVAARVLAGEALKAIANSLEDAGITTVGGKPWRAITLRNFLLAPRNWGMRVHHGEAIAKATWPGILTPEQGERLRLLLTDPKRRTNRTARRYLLSGMLRCGLCGEPLSSSPKDGTRRYACMKGPAHRNCGRIVIAAEKLEAFIADAVLYRLDSPALIESMKATADQTKITALRDAITADTARQDDLAAMWADGELSREEWKIARDRLEARVTANRHQLERLTQRDAIENYLGQGEQLREQWEGLSLSRQVAIVKAVLDHAVILPAQHPGRTGLDPERVAPQWRL